MANLIKIPYEQLHAVRSKATDGMIDKYKKILFNKNFQQRVLAIRKSFFYPLYLDKAVEKDIERDVLLETDDINLAVEILLRQFRLSDEWIYPVREFIEHSRLLLPQADVHDVSEKPLGEIPSETVPEAIVKVMYDNGKVRILLRSDHIERGNRIIPNPKILIELHAGAASEDINAVHKIITRVRSKYQKPLSQYPSKAIPVEVCNAVWMKRRQNELLEGKQQKKVADILEEIKNEFDFPADRSAMRKVMTLKDYERALQVAREEGF